MVVRAAAVDVYKSGLFQPQLADGKDLFSGVAGKFEWEILSCD